MEVQGLDVRTDCINVYRPISVDKSFSAQLSQSDYNIIPAQLFCLTEHDVGL